MGRPARRAESLFRGAPRTRPVAAVADVQDTSATAKVPCRQLPWNVIPSACSAGVLGLAERLDERRPGGGREHDPEGVTRAE